VLEHGAAAPPLSAAAILSRRGARRRAIGVKHKKAPVRPPSRVALADRRRDAQLSPTSRSGSHDRPVEHVAIYAKRWPAGRTTL